MDWSWWLLKVAFEALAKCTWLFFCNKVKAGTTPAALSFLKVQRVQTPAVLFRLEPQDLVLRSSSLPPSLNPDWQAGLVAVQLHLHWACCVLLLRSTMNVYSSSASSDSAMMSILCQLHLFSVLVSTTRVDNRKTCRHDLKLGGSSGFVSALGIILKCEERQHFYL